MQRGSKSRLGRRRFMQASAGTTLAAGWAILGRSRRARAAGRAGQLEVGEAVVDSTPPLGIEMAGFHRAKGNERVVTGIRQATAVRALVLRQGETQAAIVSVDLCGVSAAFARQVQARIARETGIPAANVRISATHTHSMPTLRYFRQWGAVPVKYAASLAGQIIQAVKRARSDLALAELRVGKERVVGGNFNRTVKSWKTDAEFTPDAIDDERWLDTTLHVLSFERAGGKRALAWYHFSAHPVCYTDGEAGPDWPGLVHDAVTARTKVRPAFLQGHCGDVNPGDGDPWLGDPPKVADAVAKALERAISRAATVQVEDLRTAQRQVQIPLDLALLRSQLARYRKDPSQCTGGEWVDAGFARAWAQGAAKWDMRKESHDITLSALQMGEVSLLFHPAELYSYYGLEIRRDAPGAHTLLVGYTDGLIGYLVDPKGYQAGEYGAVVVPKILDLPPFTPTAARTLADGAKALLTRVAV